MKASELVIDRRKRTFLWKLMRKARSGTTISFMVPLSPSYHTDLRSSLSTKLKGALYNVGFLDELKDRGLLTYYKIRAKYAKGDSAVCKANVKLTTEGKEFLERVFTGDLGSYDENLGPEDVIKYQKEVIYRQQVTIRALKKRLKALNLYPHGDK